MQWKSKQLHEMGFNVLFAECLALESGQQKGFGKGWKRSGPVLFMTRFVPFYVVCPKKRTAGSKKACKKTSWYIFWGGGGND